MEQDHPNCGTPECCGQCETSESIPLVAEQVKVPAKLHMMSKKAQKAWAERNKVDLASLSTGTISAAKAKRAAPQTTAARATKEPQVKTAEMTPNQRLQAIKDAAEKARYRNQISAHRKFWGGELGGGYSMPGSGFRRYSESFGFSFNPKAMAKQNKMVHKLAREIDRKNKQTLTRKNIAAADQKKYSMLAQKIADRVSSSLPDSDPFDVLHRDIRNLGLSGSDPLKHLDKAAKILGSKNYNSYLSSFWKQASDDGHKAFRGNNPFAEEVELDEAISVEEAAVTDYNPKSQGGTRVELLRKLTKSKSPEHATAARKAGATQAELKKAMTNTEETKMRLTTESKNTHDLVHDSGKILKKGDKVKDFRGETHTIQDFMRPLHSSSTGRVTTNKGSFYPGVINAKIVPKKANEQVEIHESDGRPKTTHENPLVTAFGGKRGDMLTHAHLSTVNKIHGTNVKHTDVHKGRVIAKNARGQTFRIELSPHHKKEVAKNSVKEEAELNEAGKFKVGDKVRPNMGPHKGIQHTVIHVHSDGKVNIRPDGNPRDNKYRHGAVSAQPHQIKHMRELGEDVTFDIREEEKQEAESRVKNKYLGIVRGRTVTGKKANPVKLNPEIKKEL